MKITKSQLEGIIKEEIQKTLRENIDPAAIAQDIAKQGPATWETVLCHPVVKKLMNGTKPTDPSASKQLQARLRQNEKQLGLPEGSLSTAEVAEMFSSKDLGGGDLYPRDDKTKLALYRAVQKSLRKDVGTEFGQLMDIADALDAHGGMGNSEGPMIAYLVNPGATPLKCPARKEPSLAALGHAVVTGGEAARAALEERRLRGFGVARLRRQLKLAEQAEKRQLYSLRRRRKK